ncbi:MAG: DUF6514 family protein [Oscillospiraceae bacterium]|nr:DUF6514 family protein [Oscillospiraceae bacterium]
MKIISENHVELPVCHRQICILYRLLSEKQDDGYTHYGIHAENAATGEALTIPDITVNQSMARRLYDSLLRGKVTTVSFREVVEDFLGSM